MRRAPIFGFLIATRLCAFSMALYHYAVTGIGDVKLLKGEQSGKLRLRLGDYRVFFSSDGKLLRILAVK